MKSGHRRTPRTWAVVTLSLIFLTLIVVVAAPVVADAKTRGVFPAIGFATLLVVSAVVAVVWSVQPVRLDVATWTAWLAGAVTLALTLGPITLWYLGRDGLGYQIFQALGVSTSPFGFGDMDVVISWLDCPRVGIDPYGTQATTCAVAPSNYGPAIFWLVPTGLTRSAVPVLGVLGVVLSALAIVWLTRQSRGWGRITLLVVSASAAWILLQERANLDAAIVWVAVALVWLVRSRAGLWPWVVAAVPIWILGAWKYYPFAMVLALLPVLRIRHGWSVIVGFLGLAIGYLFIVRDNVALSLSSNAGLSDGTFGGMGRDIAAAFIAGEAKAVTGWGWGDFIIALIVISAFIWGWTTVGRLRVGSANSPGLRRVPLTAEAMLAISGSTAIVVAVAWSGFGYNYKAALLVLGVPLLARLAYRGDTASWRPAVLMLALSVIAMFVTTNLLLVSLATLVTATFLTGAALRPLLQWLPLAPRSRDHGTAAAPSA